MPVRIVSWNCNGAFRKKFSQLAAIDADVYIVQECENPQLIADKSKEFLEFSSNHLWHGDNKNKGLAVFAKPDLGLEKVTLNHDWRGRSLKWFLPFYLSKSNQIFKFLGLWNYSAGAKAFAYIGQSWLFLQNNREFFRNAIIAGDFNSNKIWDSWDRWWNHTDYVNELSTLGLCSLYHFIYGQEQGMETQPTFLLQRNEKKKYHIDYIFTDLEKAQQTEEFKIHDFKDWIELSDHVPIEWNLSERSEGKLNGQR